MTATLAQAGGFVKPNRRVFALEPSRVRSVFLDLVRERGQEGFYVSTIVGVDLKEEGLIRVDYFVVLLPEEETVVLRTAVPRDNPVVDSIVDIVPGALSGELETHDLLGVLFQGNPYLRRGFFVPSDVAEKGVYPLRRG
ncbi:NADH-quinone oxidoreductase subunit C [Thermogladius sp. KZ2Tp1]|uniref:NADH-quinone oxidoreductase subunit C n=1 Tax=Thermogladius sp. KZ2Tp1 TaxID=3136289 RepID=UPI003DA9A5F1